MLLVVSVAPPHIPKEEWHAVVKGNTIEVVGYVECFRGYKPRLDKVKCCTLNLTFVDTGIRAFPKKVKYYWREARYTIKHNRCKNVTVVKPDNTKLKLKVEK
jgi:hypothetical protein